MTDWHYSILCGGYYSMAFDIHYSTDLESGIDRYSRGYSVFDWWHSIVSVILTDCWWWPLSVFIRNREEAIPDTMTSIDDYSDLMIFSIVDILFWCWRRYSVILSGEVRYHCWWPYSDTFVLMISHSFPLTLIFHSCWKELILFDLLTIRRDIPFYSCVYWHSMTDSDKSDVFEHRSLMILTEEVFIWEEKRLFLVTILFIPLLLLIRWRYSLFIIQYSTDDIPDIPFWPLTSIVPIWLFPVVLFSDDRGNFPTGSPDPDGEGETIDNYDCSLMTIDIYSVWWPSDLLIFFWWYWWKKPVWYYSMTVLTSRWYTVLIVVLMIFHDIQPYLFSSHYDYSVILLTSIRWLLTFHYSIR